MYIYIMYHICVYIHVLSADLLLPTFHFIVLWMGTHLALCTEYLLISSVSFCFDQLSTSCFPCIHRHFGQTHSHTHTYVNMGFATCHATATWMFDQTSGGIYNDCRMPCHYWPFLFCVWLVIIVFLFPSLRPSQCAVSNLRQTSFFAWCLFHSFAWRFPCVGIHNKLHAWVMISAYAYARTHTRE
jgi:hypothetical protein